MRRVRSSALLGLALTLGSALPAAAQGSTVEEWSVGPGTTGALVSDHRVPLVELRIELPAGTWMEWVREHHAEEAFEIQIHDTEGRLRKRSDELAADLTLAVGSRSSTLSLSCHKADLEEALALARDVLTNRDFDRDELASWRAGSRIEWKGALREPSFVISRRVAQLLFEEDDPRRDPYEKPAPISTDRDALVAARDALIRLPGRCIAFAGDLTLEEAQARARDLLPPVNEVVPDGLRIELEPVKAGDRRPRSDSVELPRLTQTYFAYARDSIPITSPDHAAALIADHALGGHYNSRLMAALRHDEGSTYAAGIDQDGGIEPGSYALTTFTRTDNGRAVTARLRELLSDFHEDGITEEERSLAASSLVGSRAFARQSPSQILDEYLWERRHGLPRGFRDHMVQRAAALSLEEVNAFIARFHDPRLFTLVTLEASSAGR